MHFYSYSSNPDNSITLISNNNRATVIKPSCSGPDAAETQPKVAINIGITQFFNGFYFHISDYFANILLIKSLMKMKTR